MAVSGGTALSGKNGKLFKGSGTPTEIEIGHWSASCKSDVFKYASSKTAGFKRAVVGNAEMTGQVDGKRLSDVPIETLIQNGTIVLLTLNWTAATKISVQVAIENLDFDVNPETGDIETFSFGFTSDGDWQFTST